MVEAGLSVNCHIAMALCNKYVQCDHDVGSGGFDHYQLIAEYSEQALFYGKLSSIGHK